MVRGKPISNELRNLIIKKHLNGDSSYKIAKYIEKPRSSVQSIIALFIKTNSVGLKNKIGRASNLTPARKRALKSVIINNRRCKINEVAVEFEIKTGHQISASTCNRWMKSIGYGHYRVSLNFQLRNSIILICDVHCFYRPRRSLYLHQIK